jgi:ubiquinone/menaquinone biosynthesis C-methylase UbiE
MSATTHDGRRVIALEPEAYLRRRAETAASHAPVRVVVRDGVADPLPLEDASFDAAVASLVLYTVPEPVEALGELRRVLKPGAELRFMEHVRSQSPRKARVQERLDHFGIWSRLGVTVTLARARTSPTRGVRRGRESIWKCGTRGKPCSPNFGPRRTSTSMRATA